MNILYIVNVCHDSADSSAPPFVKSQIESIQRAGHRTTIYTIKGNTSIRSYYNAFFEIQKLIKKENFDIIHAHYSYSGFTVVLQRKVPVVISFMGSDLYGSYKADGTLSFRGYIDVFLSKVLQYLVKGIIVKSKEMSEMLSKKKHHIILPNGVNFKHFKEIPRCVARKRLGMDLEKKIILFIGNPRSTRKCFSIVFTAVNLLKENDANLDLVVVHGFDHEDIPYYLNAANVLVLASIKEGSPNVIKEAMACNLPIVSTDVGDVKELTQGVQGCKIVARDKNAIAKAVREILDNFKRTNGRTVIQHLSLESVADELIEFYRHIMASKMF